MTKPELDSFSALLATSFHQQEPQRLLFVFARRELGDHASAAQREAFERGTGGHLQPVLCVDKAPEEVASFEALSAESAHTGQTWDVVFVSTLEGRGGIPPNSDQADQPLRFMVNAIHEGRVDEMAAFDHQGEPLSFVRTP